MQFIPFCLFTIICGYSLVNSAPINQTNPDSQEIKHQKAIAIADRLLKEIADEQHSVEFSNTDNIVSETQPTESDLEKQEDDEEDAEYIPTIDELYQLYDDDSSSEMDDIPYNRPVSDQELIRYLKDRQEFDEDLTPVIHTPIIDDSIMKSEDH